MFRFFAAFVGWVGWVFVAAMEHAHPAVIAAAVVGLFLGVLPTRWFFVTGGLQVALWAALVVNLPEARELDELHWHVLTAMHLLLSLAFYWMARSERPEPTPQSLSLSSSSSSMAVPTDAPTPSRVPMPTSTSIGSPDDE